jgi:hypothetical protein
MKKLLFINFFVLLIVGQAFGWGQNGHRVVGFVAQEHLNRKASKKLSQILDCNSLAQVSVWMDDIKSDDRYNHTHDWHWVTVPEGKEYAATDKNPNGDLLMKINELIAALKKGGLSKEQEQEHIKYLVHLVGDLHQPLHVGKEGDTGGNAIKVKWFGGNSNLHRVWDSEMIESKDLGFTEIASFMCKPGKAQLKAWQSSSVEDWAAESMALRPQVYDLPENMKLGYEYMYKNYGTVELRLQQAGIRLAKLLNEIYG